MKALPSVGDQIQVYWPDDQQYYSGCVAKYEKRSRCYRIEYDDGDVETLDLRKETWRSVPRNLSSSTNPETLSPEYLNRLLTKSASGYEYTSSDVPSFSTCSTNYSKHYEARMRVPSARELIARNATKWLQDESRRLSLSTQNAYVRERWIDLCTHLCVCYVHDALLMQYSEENSNEAKHGQLFDLLYDNTASISWLHEHCHYSSLRKARKNYRHWSSAMSDCEWQMEMEIMRRVSRCFRESSIEPECECASACVKRALGMAKVAVQTNSRNRRPTILGTS